MYNQIHSKISAHSSKTAYIYCDDKQMIYSRTYKDIICEAEQIIDLFSKVPRGFVIAIQLDHKPCLLPIIYCVLQQKLTFLLIEENETLEKYKDIKIFSLITCLNHTNGCGINVKEIAYEKLIRTRCDCAYKLQIFKHSLLEEEEISICNQNICYVIATSGTMGEQKIVRVSENSIYSNIKSFIKLFRITQNDVIYFGTPLSFDPALVELFLGLTTGACLLSTPKSVRNNPGQLIDAMFSHKYKTCTFLQMCPSFFSQFSKKQLNYIYYKSGLRILGLGGEPFPSDLLPPKTPKCKIYNFYGITEVSCWASVEEVKYGQEISLGIPLDDTKFYIENDLGVAVRNWESCKEFEGTLFIQTFLRFCFVDIDEIFEDAELVSRSYCTGDCVKVKNGKIYYYGRENDIIKRFGHRLSLVNMQNIIYSSIKLPNVCMYYNDTLICFIKVQLETVNFQELEAKTIDKIRVKLLKELPSKYMPDIIELLSVFPIKSSNGKIDIVVLENVAEDLLKFRYCKNLKDVFLKLWSKQATSRNLQSFYDKTFWDIGGNSILALQFAKEYEKITKVCFNRSLLDLPLQTALEMIKDPKDNKNMEVLPNCSKKYFNIEWKADMQACIDSKPVVCSVSENNYVAVGNFAHTFSVFCIETGKQIASISLPNVIESSVLIIANNFYVPCFDGRLYCLRLQEDNATSTLDMVWSYKTGDRLKNTPCICGNYIVFASYDNYVYSISKKKVLKWKTYIGEPVTAEIKLFNAKLYIGALKGNIYCLDTRSGAILWSYKALYPIFNSPEIVFQYDIIVFVDIGSNLYAFSKFAYKLMWTLHTTYEIANINRSFGSMLITNNLIILGTEKGNINIYEFDKSTCILKRSISVSTNQISIISKPLLFNVENEKYLIVVNTAGEIFLYQIDFKSNEDEIVELELMEVYNLPNQCFSSLELCDIYENRFYLGCRDDNLYCIEIAL